MKNARELIYYSSKAPSGHNSQPWKFKIQGETIEIHPDFNFALPIVDPDHRELFISLGCAAENICVASSHFGYKCNWEILQNAKGNHYIIVEFNESKTIVNKKLIEHLDKRQTNRSVYDGKQVDNEAVTQLKELTYEDNIDIYFFQNGEPHFQNIKNSIIKGNGIQMNDSEFKEELLSWIRFNKRDVNRLQNGLTYKVMGSPPMPKFIGKAIVKSFLKPEKQNKTDLKKLIHLRTLFC